MSVCSSSENFFLETVDSVLKGMLFGSSWPRGGQKGCGSSSCRSKDSGVGGVWAGYGKVLGLLSGGGKSTLWIS